MQKVKQQRKRKKTDSTPPLPPPAKTTDLTGNIMKKMSTNYSLAIQRNPNEGRMTLLKMMEVMGCTIDL